MENFKTFPSFNDFSAATTNSSHGVHVAEKSRSSLEDANSDFNDIFVAGAAIAIAYVHCS